MDAKEAGKEYLALIDETISGLKSAKTGKEVAAVLEKSTAAGEAQDNQRV